VSNLYIYKGPILLTVKLHWSTTMLILRLTCHVQQPSHKMHCHWLGSLGSSWQQTAVYM